MNADEPLMLYSPDKLLFAEDLVGYVHNRLFHQHYQGVWASESRAVTYNAFTENVKLAMKDLVRRLLDTDSAFYDALDASNVYNREDFIRFGHVLRSRYVCYGYDAFMYLLYCAEVSTMSAIYVKHGYRSAAEMSVAMIANYLGEIDMLTGKWYTLQMVASRLVRLSLNSYFFNADSSEVEHSDDDVCTSTTRGYSLERLKSNIQGTVNESSSDESIDDQQLPGSSGNILLRTSETHHEQARIPPDERVIGNSTVDGHHDRILGRYCENEGPLNQLDPANRTSRAAFTIQDILESNPESQSEVQELSVKDTSVANTFNSENPQKELQSLDNEDAKQLDSTKSSLKRNLFGGSQGFTISMHSESYSCDEISGPSTELSLQGSEPDNSERNPGTNLKLKNSAEDDQESVTFKSIDKKLKRS